MTDLEQATRDLERTVSLLEATLDAAADGVLVVDRSGVITTYNRRFLEMWRIPPELASLRDDQTLLAHVERQLQDPDEFRQDVRDLYDRPEAESCDVLRFHDGRVFERTSLPQRVGAETVGRVWSFHDVTDRERMLQTATFLSDATRLLASLDVANALQGVARLAVPFLADGVAADLVTYEGMKRVAAVMRDPSRPFALAPARGVPGGHPSILQRGESSCMVVPLVTKEGPAGLLTFEAARGRRYGDSELDLARELSRRVALALENARMLDRWREALRARDEFLSIAAHEIRGPVTSIHLAIQSLLERGVDAPGARRLFEVIERGDLRLTRFVDELLDVGRIQGDRLHFQYEEMDLGDLIREVAARLTEDISRSGSILSITIDGELKGEWDRSRLDQVIANLLANAIKFGQGQPIEISARASGGEAVLEVRDHGIGVPADKLERIFRPFERAVPSRNYGGLGLGLYIVRTIVEGLGGTIRAQAAPGGGTVFSLTLPQTRPE